MTLQGGSPFGDLETATGLTGGQIEARARDLLAQLAPGEKFGLMSGEPTFRFGLADIIGGGYSQHVHIAGAVPGLGIRGIRFSDGPRGVAPHDGLCQALRPQFDGKCPLSTKRP